MSNTTRFRWLDTHPESRVVNSESYGIARVEVLGGRLFVNNTSRNLEMSLPEENGLRLLSKFHQTAYPDDDVLSMYDLDFHALLLTSQGTHLFARTITALSGRSRPPLSASWAASRRRT